jgi:membrane fusion protein, multidrug efflux system
VSRNRTLFLIAALVLIAGGIGLLMYRDYRATHVNTDDAFVEGRIHTIAPRIPGPVRLVNVTDNQSVRAGDLLLELDPSDYEVKVNEAASSVESERMKSQEMQNRRDAAEKQMAEIKAGIEAAKANVVLQQANLAQADLDMKRYENLYRQEAISKERYEKTKTAFDVSEAQVKAARERVKQLEASLATQTSLIRQAQAGVSTQAAVARNKEAVLAGATLNKSYTRIVAPVDGYVTKKSVEAGNQVAPGTPLLALVPLDDIWIIANYKETQLTRVKRGQKVEIEVDTYPGKKWYGKVESIMAGTGSTFSLFPPENATGNYVKVVQRIPVKVLLDKGSDKDHVLRIGMSVVATIIIE